MKTVSQTKSEVKSEPVLETKWSLDDLYTGFDSPEYQQDFENMQKQIQTITHWADENLQSTDNAVEKIETYITMRNDFARYMNLIHFASLMLSVNTMDMQAAKALDILEERLTILAKPNVQFESFVAQLPNLDELIEKSELLETHRFVLEELKANSIYRLSEAEEILLAKLQNTGSGLWAKMHEQLTSTLLVDMTWDNENKALPLSVVRNYAYEKDGVLRKTAYEAELKAYEKIHQSASFALNGVKGEALTIAAQRGYDSPLDMSLIGSRMSRKTLEAMLSAIVDALPVFQNYLCEKAAYLGHSEGLPFYDLFAPVGTLDIHFTYDEAADFIITNFNRFSKKLGDFAEHAFQKQWIDAFPYYGKRGGAFCDNLHNIQQSRILTNFTGSLSDVTTLAHELGHAYHGACLDKETYLNSYYPMPIAESASIFCETIVANAAQAAATPEEAVIIAEGTISDMTQVIVDIYSRFLFEDEVFKQRQNGNLSVEELNAIMLTAQKKAYGNGLNKEYLHPYMWLCKPHYYCVEENYYNFPYAYGLLFSKGLYAKYLEAPTQFVPKYEQFLGSTGKSSMTSLGVFMGIDVESKSFWENALQLIKKDIERCSLKG